MTKEELEEKLKRITQKAEGTMPSTGNLQMEHYPEEAKQEILPFGSLYDFLLERNQKHMNDVGIVFAGKNIIYEELHTHIDEYARALYKRGIREGDVVSLGLANTPEAIYLTYALNKLGAITTPINPTYNAYKMKRDIEITQPKWYIGINDCYKNFKEASRGLSIEKIVYPVVASINDKKLNILYTLKQILDGNYTSDQKKQLLKIVASGKDYPDAIYPSYKSGKISDIMFTGGSTGIHKGVDLEANGLNCVVKSLDYVLCLKPGETFMVNMPFFMSFGKLALHYSLCNSLRTDLTLKAMPNDFVDELLRGTPAGVMGGPIHWEQLISTPKLRDGSLSFLKMPISGGEQLKYGSELKINEALAKYGAKTTLWNGLGASEMWAPVSVKRGNENSVGTIGTTIPFNNQKIISLVDGHECGYNEDGILWMSGPGMMLGYHNNPEETEKVIVKDDNGKRWYNMGDIACMKDDGEIIYRGRNKRIFVCGVDNVYPEQLETLISEIPGIEEIVITKIPDDNLQYVPKAHIVLKNKDDDKDKIINKINNKLSSTLGNGVIPAYYRFYDYSFPKTDSGKVDTFSVEELDKEEQPKVYKKTN